jgi:hypothetical protein
MTSHYDAEELKNLLVEADRTFHLTRPASEDADYQILWYKLPPSCNGRPRNCKVDILVPGTMGLPWIRASRIESVLLRNTLLSLPCMPLEALLLMKLRGWSDHRHSDRSDFQGKIPADENDIDQLLDICVENDVWFNRATWLSWFFRKNGFRRARAFVNVKGQDERWRQLGFRV